MFHLCLDINNLFIIYPTLCTLYLMQHNMNLETFLNQKGKKIDCLNKACKAGHVDIVKAIISSINTYDYGSDTFYSACEGGNIEITKLIYALCKLSNGVKNMSKLLYYGIGGACCYGNINVVKFYMHELQKYPNILKRHIDTYFINACESGNIELVHYIMRENSNSCKIYFPFNFSLRRACIGGNLEIVKLLLENGAICDSYIVLLACKAGNIEIVELLLTKCVKSGKRVVLTDNCLISACEGKNIKMVEFLINKGLTNWGDCFRKACEINCFEIMELMIVKSQEVKIECVVEHVTNCSMNLIKTIKLMMMKQPTPVKPAILTTPTTPMSLSQLEFWNKGLEGACSGKNIEIVKFISRHIWNDKDCENGENNKNSTINWNRCLHNACYGGSMEIVDFVIKNAKTKENTNITDWNKGLHIACGEGHIDIIKCMISMGANDWHDAAYGSCRSKHIEITKYMISKGFGNLDNVNKLFVYACGEGLTEIAELLIKNGANNWGDGSYVACMRGYIGCVQLILKYGTNDIELLTGMLCTYVMYSDYLTIKGLVAGEIPPVPNNSDICILIVKQGGYACSKNMSGHKFKNTLNTLQNIDNLTLYCLCCKYGYFNSDADIYINLLMKHPPYILLVSCKSGPVNKKCHMNRLPTELFRLLFEYC